MYRKNKKRRGYRERMQEKEEVCIGKKEEREREKASGEIMEECERMRPVTRFCLTDFKCTVITLSTQTRRDGHCDVEVGRERWIKPAVLKYWMKIKRDKS